MMKIPFLHRKNRRDIFEYHDGIRCRQADPLVAWRIMWEHGECSPDDDFGPATGVDGEGNPVEYDPAALERVLTMVRDMFGVKPWSEEHGGLTIDSTMQLLWQYLDYMNALKKKRDRLLTQLAPSVSKSSAESTTPPESDSSSTSPESKSDEPSPSSKRSVVL